MNILDRQKKTGHELALAHGHDMSRWYKQVDGYYLSYCGYNCDCEMIIEPQNVKGEPWFLWGDAINKDCTLKV